ADQGRHRTTSKFESTCCLCRTNGLQYTTAGRGAGAWLPGVQISLPDVVPLPMAKVSSMRLKPPVQELLSTPRDASEQCALGDRFETGTVAAQDYFRAMSWYRKAADQGYARAQHNLARMSLQGHGATANPAEAANWYRRAAAQGFARAQSPLARLCHAGRGH